MMRRVLAAFAAALCVAGCGSAPDAAETPPPVPQIGVVTVANIPPKYTGGIILVNGENGKGETFTYSPKIFQKCTGTTMDVNVYSSVRAVQTPFSGNGEFLVTISLYEAADHNRSEIKQIKAHFVNGSAALRW